jgi:amino acid transporter
METPLAPPKLGGHLTTVDCVAQSLAVGPIFSAAAIGGALAGLAGGVGPFVVILTTVGILALGYVISELAKRYSGSGTVYELIAHTAGKRAAVFGAASYYFAVAALLSGLPVIGGITARDFFYNHMGIDAPWWVWGLVIIALVTIVNVVGVQVSVRAQLTIIGLSLIPFLILCIVIIAKGGSGGNTLSVFNPGHVAEGGSVFKGLLFAILMFVGFEMAAALGEETANPKKSIPTAVLTTIGIVSVFYILTQYAGTIGSGGPNQLPFDFPTLATEYVGRWLSVLVELAVLLDILGIAIGFTAATSRGIFTLSRDGLMPKALMKLNSKKIPITATLVMTAINLVVLFVSLAKYKTTVPVDTLGAPAGPPNVLNAFLIASTIGAMVFCVVYVVLCVGAVKLFLRNHTPAGIVAAVIGGVTAGGGVLAQFVKGTAPTGDALWGRHLALVGLGLIIVWLVVQSTRHADRVDAAGQHALQHEAV